MSKDPIRVVGYRRVSTEDQAEKGSSLEAQTDRIREYCRANGLDLVDLLEDAGESAKSLERPGIQRALSMLAGGQVAGLVVSYLDRLTRHVGDLVELVERHFIRPDGPKLLSATEHIDTRTSAGRMQLYFLGLLSQYQREQGAEKTADIMGRKRKGGERTGNLRFGTAVDPSDPRRGRDGQPIALVESAEDRETARLIHRLRAELLSYQQIADELNRRGIPSKRGITRRSTGKWAKSSISAVLHTTRIDGTPLDEH